MLMLIIMIYSGVLFVAVILGLVTGHVFFNAMDAIWPIHGSPSVDDVGTDISNDAVNGDENVGVLRRGRLPQIAPNALYDTIFGVEETHPRSPSNTS